MDYADRRAARTQALNALEMELARREEMRLPTTTKRVSKHLR